MSNSGSVANPVLSLIKKILNLPEQFESGTRSSFHSLGLKIGVHRWAVVITICVLTVFCSLGFIFFEERNDVRYDYGALHSPSRHEYDVVQEFYQEHGKPFYLVVTIRTKDTGNILRSPYLQHAENITNYLHEQLTITDDRGVSRSYQDLCGSNCLGNKPVSVFMEYYSALGQRSPNVRLTFPTMEIFGEPVYLASNFLDVRVDERSQYLESCTLLVLHFRAVNSNETMTDLLHQWEQAVYEFVISMDKHPILQLATMNEGLVSIEVRRTGMAAFPYLSLSILVIIIFVLVSTLHKDLNRYKPLEALLGVSCPMMALATAFGVLLAIGVDYMPVITVAPFLVLAIGVDDVFIALHSWHQTDTKLTSTQRLAAMLASAGPSITITSATNVLAFAVGAFTPTPAIQHLCVYTCVAVTVGYLYQIFFFSAVLVIGGEYEAQAKTDSETKSKLTTLKESISQLSDRCNKQYNRLIDWWAGQAGCELSQLMVCVFMLVYWAVTIYGCSTVHVELSVEKLFLSDSPLLAFIDIQKRYLFKEGGQLYVFVNNPGDMRRDDRRQSIMKLVNAFQTRPENSGPDTTVLWLPDYMKFLGFQQNSNAFFDTSELGFNYTFMSSFLSNPFYERWKYFLNWHPESCARNQAGCISKFVFVTGFRNATEYHTRLELLQQWREMIKDFEQMNVTIYEDMAMYADQIASIGPVYVSTVSAAIVCMFVVCVLFIPHVSSIICATLSVISINLGVFGTLMLWNVNLDPMSTSTFLMSIGFSVDFTAHISYHYYRSTCSSDSPSERVRHALHSISWPMLQAGISTVLATVVLCIVQAYMIEVFTKTVFLVVLFGLIHGLIVLPVVLTALSQRSTSGTSHSKAMMKLNELGGTDNARQPIKPSFWSLKWMRTNNSVNTQVNNNTQETRIDDTK